MSTTIYGSSDDLIEFEGDFREEFNYYPDDEEYAYIALSNGTVIRVYFDGEWGFKILRGTGNVKACPVEGADNDYTDVVTIEEPVTWAVLGEHWAGKSI